MVRAESELSPLPPSFVRVRVSLLPNWYFLFFLPKSLPFIHPFQFHGPEIIRPEPLEDDGHLH